MKPKILIYANVYDTTVGQGIPYMEFFSKFGDVILITSEMDLEYWLNEGNILALPGGMDVLSTRYGMSPGFNSKLVNSHYEYLDEKLLLPWIDTGKPILGICRGMQVLNVAMGGTLYTHIDGHDQTSPKTDRWDRTQEMYMFNGNGRPYVHMVNSYHHQAVKDIAPGFEVMGWSDLDVWGTSSIGEGTIKYHNNQFVPIDKRAKDYKIEEGKVPMVPEIIRHKELPYIAFQYHPEEFNCYVATKLIKYTIKTYEDSSSKNKKTNITITAPNT